MKIYLFGLIIALAFYTANSQIVINEASSTNSEAVIDEDHDSPDWIELYNTSDDYINLKSWRIGDKTTFDKAWEFPDITIAPKEHLLIYASDKNRSNSGKFIMEASGNGIYPHSFHDSYRFSYIAIEGDFDFSVQVNSLSNIETFGSTGLIIREDLTDWNRFYGVLSQKDDREYIEYLQREYIGDYPVRNYSHSEMIYPNVVLQVSRHGDSLIAGIYDIEGYCLESLPTVWKFPKQAYVGLALSSTKQFLDAKASFSNHKINGEPADFSILKGQDFNLLSPGKSYFSKELHTDFKLSRSGETITLWNDNEAIVDQLTIPSMYVDMSYGRYPDGGDSLKYFYPTTPQKTNANVKEGLLIQPTLSLDAGFYDNSVEVSLYHNKMNARIRYTIDGSEPTEKSPIFSGNKLQFNKTTVLKARVYLDSYIPSEILTATYFINEHDAGLPTISFSSDSMNFFDEKLGLFQKPHHGFEYPVSIEYFNKNRSRVISNRMGMKTQGHGGSLGTQTSLRFKSQSKYGESELEYPFFGNNGFSVYDKIIIRNSGQDWGYAFIRDAFVGILGNYIDNVFGTQYQPVMGYLNGEFWGMYNLRERFDDDFLATKFGISPNSVSIMEPIYRLMQGSSRTYRELVDNIPNAPEEEIYDMLDEVLDIKNLIDYSTVKFWANNADWKRTNYKFWRSSELDNKWRWILMDYDISLNRDFTSDYKDNLFEPAMDSGATNPRDYHFEGILYNAFRNERFAHQFLSRACDLLNTTLKSDFLTPILDSLVANIAEASVYQKARWEGSMVNSTQHYSLMRSFFRNRPVYFREQLLNYFGLSGISKIKLSANIDSACSYKVNSLENLPQNWEGYYFDSIPLNITAVPHSGFTFKHWTIGDSVISTEESLWISLSDSVNVVAIFSLNDDDDGEDEEDSTETNIVINEIMFKSAKDFDTNDWVELLNAGDKDVNLSGWIFKDDDNKHSFILPEGIILKSNDYLVLISDENAFANLHPNVDNYIATFDFGLGTNDEVRLFDENGIIVDSVSYTNISPWYPEADGKGPSLELISPTLDNTLPESWQVSSIKGGTPGRPNSTVSVNKTILENYIRVYPNPASISVNISFSLDFDSKIDVKICDIFGNTINEILNGEYQAGSYSSYWDGKNNDGKKMSSGLYFVIISTNQGIIREKLILE